MSYGLPYKLKTNYLLPKCFMYFVLKAKALVFI